MHYKHARARTHTQHIHTHTHTHTTHTKHTHTHKTHTHTHTHNTHNTHTHTHTQYNFGFDGEAHSQQFFCKGYKEVATAFRVVRNWHSYSVCAYFVFLVFFYFPPPKFLPLSHFSLPSFAPAPCMHVSSSSHVSSSWCTLVYPGVGRHWHACRVCVCVCDVPLMVCDVPVMECLYAHTYKYSYM